MRWERRVWPPGNLGVCPNCNQSAGNLTDHVASDGRAVVWCRNCWIEWVVVPVVRPVPPPPVMPTGRRMDGVTWAHLQRLTLRYLQPTTAAAS